MVKTYQELYRKAKNALEPMDGDLAGVAAGEILALAAGKTKEEVLRDILLIAPETVPEKMDALLQEYMDGRPLQYMVGHWSFFGLPFKLEESVLIPRDDSMVVAALAMEAIKDADSPRVLDLCTGTGCIGISIAHHIPSSRVTLLDVSDDAVHLAKENVTALHLSGRASVVKGDVLEPAPTYLGLYDVIVANPPYIATSEIEDLPHSVKDFEPRLALDGGADGLRFYRAICENYSVLLKPEGALCLEFGIGQETAVEKILQEYGFTEQVFCKDTAKIIRAVIARKNGKE